MSDVTRILSQIEAGDPSAADQLLPLIYEQLRSLAAAKLSQEKPGQTLQATALVHEAYLRLVSGPAREGEARAAREGEAPAEPSADLPPLATDNWNSRGHFFGAAAEAMRRILVERARRKHAAKRGGQQQRIELTDIPATEPGAVIDLLALDEALNELTAVDPRAADLVKLRYFAGLSGADAAKSLGISPRTADRTWLYARTWLLKKLENTERP